MYFCLLGEEAHQPDDSVNAFNTNFMILALTTVAAQQLHSILGSTGFRHASNQAVECKVVSFKTLR